MQASNRCLGLSVIALIACKQRREHAQKCWGQLPIFKLALNMLVECWPITLRPKPGVMERHTDCIAALDCCFITGCGCPGIEMKWASPSIKAWWKNYSLNTTFTKMMKMKPLDTRHSHPAATMQMMDYLTITDEQVLRALHHSRLVENLRDFEVNALVDLFTIRHFAVSELVAELDDSLKDTLMILVEGNLEVNAMVGNESVVLHLKAPGDLARIISFVGGNIVNISARITVRKKSAVLLLQRSRLESLLHTHPAIVYCVMRNLIQHVHGVSRRKTTENKELSNYVYRMNGRY